MKTLNEIKDALAGQRSVLGEYNSYLRNLDLCDEFPEHVDEWKKEVIRTETMIRTLEWVLDLYDKSPEAKGIGPVLDCVVENLKEEKRNRQDRK